MNYEPDPIEGDVLLALADSDHATETTSDLAWLADLEVADTLRACWKLERNGFIMRESGETNQETRWLVTNKGEAWVTKAFGEKGGES